MTRRIPAPPAPHQGMRTFFLIWAGGTVSALGSALTGFVLGVWAFQETASTTLYSMVIVAAIVPAFLAAPFAGALADRWDRRRTMIGCNLLAIAVSAVLIVLMRTERLEIWHLYVTSAILSLGMSVQRPAHMAATTVLVPPKHFGRASGMMQFGMATIRIVAPILAGILLARIHAAQVLMIDLASFLVSLAVLLAVTIPPPPAAPGGAPRAPLWRDAGTGWRYIRERPGIFGLLVFFATIGVAPLIGMTFLTPLVLGFADEIVLGQVMAAGGAGALAGGFLMSTWGGPRRRFHGIVAASLLLGVSIIVAGLRPDPALIAVGTFGMAFGGPVATASFNALWQTKTPLELHGRVFSIILMIAESTAPVALLAAGPLTDHLLDPLFRPGGGLADSLGPYLGTGPGRGIGFLYVGLGVFVLAVTAVASRLPRLRFAEDELQDAVAAPPPAPPGAPAPAAADGADAVPAEAR